MLSLSWQRRLHSRARRRGCASVQSLLHRRQQPARLPVRRRRPARHRDGRSRSAAISIISAPAEVRFPLGLPEELRIFGRAFVDAGSLRDIDVSGPTLDESDGLRVGTRRGSVLALAARSALDRFRRSRSRRKTRTTPNSSADLLRHPVLMSA